MKLGNQPSLIHVCYITQAGIYKMSDAVFVICISPGLCGQSELLRIRFYTVETQNRKMILLCVQPGRVWWKGKSVREGTELWTIKNRWRN